MWYKIISSLIRWILGQRKFLRRILYKFLRIPIRERWNSNKKNPLNIILVLYFCIYKFSINKCTKITRLLHWTIHKSSYINLTFHDYTLFLFVFFNREIITIDHHQPSTAIIPLVKFLIPNNPRSPTRAFSFVRKRNYVEIDCNGQREFPDASDVGRDRWCESTSLRNIIEGRSRD